MVSDGETENYIRRKFLQKFIYTSDLYSDMTSKINGGKSQSLLSFMTMTAQKLISIDTTCPSNLTSFIEELKILDSEANVETDSLYKAIILQSSIYLNGYMPSCCRHMHANADKHFIITLFCDAYMITLSFNCLSSVGSDSDNFQ